MFNSLLNALPILSGDEGIHCLKIWLLTSKEAQKWRQANIALPVCDSDNKEENPVPSSQESVVTEANVTVTANYANSQEKGEILENALMRLLRLLFDFDDEDNKTLLEQTVQTMDFLKQRDRGTQNGRDIDLIFKGADNKKYHCHFECKYVTSTSIKDAQLEDKIKQDKRTATTEIEHWILFAPTSTLNHYAIELVQEAEKSLVYIIQ